MINENKLLEWMHEVQYALVFGRDDDYEGFPKELSVEAITPSNSEQGEESQSHRTTQAAQNAEDSTSGDPAERPVP